VPLVATYSLKYINFSDARSLGPTRTSLEVYEAVIVVLISEVPARGTRTGDVYSIPRVHIHYIYKNGCYALNTTA
jgi:hypothetical protein